MPPPQPVTEAVVKRHFGWTDEAFQFALAQPRFPPTIKVAGKFGSLVLKWDLLAVEAWRDVRAAEARLLKLL